MSIRTRISDWVRRLCVDRPRYASRFEAEGAAARAQLVLGGEAVEPYRCVLCHILGHPGWHLTDPGVRSGRPGRWRPML